MAEVTATQPLPKLTAKIFITGKIVAETGLHVGGSKAALDIGGIDLNVIKTARGVPFIPGSSLKGKLRSMLAKLHGSESVKTDTLEIKEMFGDSGENDGRGSFTRLLVRDAFLDETAFGKTFESAELELDFSESKWENTINRRTGTALNPRQIERVPAGAQFCFELVYDVYDDAKEDTHLGKILTAMRLLASDYIGGSGSRGYGKIRFEAVSAVKKSIGNFYEKATGEAIVETLTTFKL